MTEAVALLNSLSKIPSSDTTNTALLKQLWNDSIRVACSANGGKLRFLETTTTIATVASQRAYAVPARMRKVIDLYVTVGTTVYTPTPVEDPERWNAILASNLGESDVPLFYRVRGREIDLAPVPASANTMTIRGRLTVPDMTFDDDTVTVTALANGGTAVTVSSGALATMAGKFLRITKLATGAAGGGDGYWYEISSASPTTSITLAAPYQGTTLSGASASATVGEMSPLPEAYNMLPIYRALALITRSNDPLHSTVSNDWWRLYDGGYEAGFRTDVGGMMAQMLENEGESTEGAYISPYGLGNLDPNNPPQQELTGF